MINVGSWIRTDVGVVDRFLVIDTIEDVVDFHSVPVVGYPSNG